MPSDAPILADYRIRCEPADADAYAQAVALEQSVEVPESLIAARPFREQVAGRVEAVAPAEENGVFHVRVAYPSALAAGQLPQLLNLLYGNISIHKNIQLADLTLPEPLLAQFPGPRHGIDGLRRLTGVFGRPLLATALKPRGETNEAFARIAYAFALGGGDLIKDDHNLADPDFDGFRARVDAVHDAVRSANGATGRNTLYVPNVAAPAGQLDRYLQYLAARGVPGFMVCPYIAGLDVTRSLAARHGLLTLAHPAFSGAYYRTPDHGLAPGVALGTLMRLAGADVSIFPNHGGRFGFTRDECLAIRTALQAPLGGLRPAWPAPAGGMQLDRIASMAADYGEDAVLLVGGALLSHGDDLRASTEVFLGEVRKSFTERLESPGEPVVSACEARAPATPTESLRTWLPFDPERFAWEGRAPVAYKAEGALPFDGVARHELLGRHGEAMAFDLRYFELAPGGYTSHERHAHTHTLVTLRGQGELLAAGEHRAMRPFDVAYVPPMTPHQLRNPHHEPFGFLCIVDRVRDRPQAP